MLPRVCFWYGNENTERNVFYSTVYNDLLMFKKAEQNETQPFFKSHDMGNIWGIERLSSTSVSDL